MKGAKGAENYTVFGFMTRGLGLSGAELQVYAVIYSFSRDGKGTFSGSRGYLAATVGFSTATVDRAIKKLLERGIIKRTRAYRTHHEYAAVIPSGIFDDTRQNDDNERAQNDEITVHQNDERESSNCEGRVVNLTNNNKDDNKEIINTSPPPPPLSARRDGGCAHTQKKEKKEIFKKTKGKGTAGRAYDTEEEEDEYISLKCIEGAAFDHYLTYEQYEHLCDIVDERTVLDYFIRLDCYMYENRRARPHSAYRTVLKWIKEDFGGIEK